MEDKIKNSKANDLFIIGLIVFARIKSLIIVFKLLAVSHFGTIQPKLLRSLIYPVFG